jgi:hypothetical protein
VEVWRSGRGDKDHRFGEIINQGQGLGFTSSCEALALEIHSIAGAGFVRSVGGEEAVREASFTLFIFTQFTILTDATHISLHGGPKVVAG